MNQFAPGWVGFVSFVLAIVLPALVALVTKESWSGTVKSLVLLALAAAKSVAEAFVLNGHLSVDTLTATAYTFVIGVAGYAVIKGTPLHVALVDNGISDPPLPTVPVSAFPARLGSVALAVREAARAFDGLPPGFEMPLIPVEAANGLADAVDKGTVDPPA